MLLINDLFSDSDLYHIFWTPQRSGKSRITIISEKTWMPSVFLGISVSWRLERLRTKYFLVHFSLNHCQRKNDKFWNAVPPPFSEYTHRGYVYFSTTRSYIIFLLSDKIHMFQAQTICHSRFFCTKVIDAFLSWLISFYNFIEGAFDRRNFHTSPPQGNLHAQVSSVTKGWMNEELSVPKQSRASVFLQWVFLSPEKAEYSWKIIW